MSTENENILKERVEQLQLAMCTITQQLAEVVRVANQNTDMVDTPYGQQFYDMSEVQIYLPFYLTPESIISVMVEENGQFRQVSPALTLNGNQITVNFDRTYTGIVKVTGPASVGSHVTNLGYVNIDSTPISFYEPAEEPAYVEPEQPSNVTEIFPTQNRSIGEIITQDIERAMGVLD